MGVQQSLGLFWPELILAGTLLVLVFADLFVSRGDDARRGEIAGTLASCSNSRGSPSPRSSR